MNIKLSKNGSTIKIKKSNKGKFTEYCEGKVTDECISRAKKSKSLKIRKRAIFAENARTWKHQFGGSIIDRLEDQRESINTVIKNPGKTKMMYPKSNANFIKRLKGPNRQTLPNNVSINEVKTHKLSYSGTDQGDLVFPEVQEINGKLIDLGKKAYKSAIINKDYIIVPDGEYFTTQYKKYYPTFKHQFGGTIEVKGNAKTYNKIAGIGSTVLSTVGNAITAGKTQSAMNKANELNRQLDNQQQLLDISTANAEALNLQQNSANSSYTNGIYKDIYNLQQQIQLNYNNPSVVRQLTNQLNAKQNLLNNQITLAGTTDTTAQQKLVDNLKGQTQNAYQDVQSSSNSGNLLSTAGSLLSNISFKNKDNTIGTSIDTKTFNQNQNNIVDQSKNMLQRKGILNKYSTLNTPKFEITQPSKISSFNIGGNQ